MIGEPLYWRRGKRYERVGYNYVSWPADGLWLITDRAASATQIADLDTLKQVSAMTIGKLNLYRKECADVVVAMRDKKAGVSAYDLVSAIFAVLSKREEQEEGEST